MGLRQIHDQIKDAGSNPTTKRSLDHFVNLVDDIETGAAMYEHLGFRLMPVMEHVEIGTSNVCIQLKYTYIELIGDIANCVSDQIVESMCPWQDADKYIYWQTSFTSECLENDYDQLVAAGLEPEDILSARRRVRKIGGGWDETDSRSRYTFNKNNITGSLFRSDHRKPEAIWMPGYTCHPNTADRVVGISYIARDVSSDLEYYRAMTEGEPASQSSEKVVFNTPRGDFFEIVSERAAKHLLPGSSALQPGLNVRGAAYTVQVSSLERCQLVLRDGGVPCDLIDDILVTPAAFGGGMSFMFVEHS
jgi:hypothetical protein